MFNETQSIVYSWGSIHPVNEKDDRFLIQMTKETFLSFNYCKVIREIKNTLK